jgi:hypothetical protein
MAMMESYMITAVVNAKQGRDVITANVSYAFVQTHIKQMPIGKKTIMKIKKTLVNVLVNRVCLIQRKSKVLYIEMKKLYMACSNHCYCTTINFKRTLKKLDSKIILIIPVLQTGS